MKMGYVKEIEKRCEKRSVCYVIHPSTFVCYMLSLINFHQKLFPFATSLFHTKFFVLQICYFMRSWGVVGWGLFGIFPEILIFFF